MDKSKFGSNKSNGYLGFSNLSYSSIFGLAVVISALISTVCRLDDYGNIWVVGISISAWMSSLLIYLKNGSLNKEQRKIWLSSFTSTIVSLLIYKVVHFYIPLDYNFQWDIKFFIPYLANTLLVTSSLVPLFYFSYDDVAKEN